MLKQRHQAAASIVVETAHHRGHPAQGSLRTGAAGLAQCDELRRHFNDQDVRHRDIGNRLRFGPGHDGNPFRPGADVIAVGESNPHRAQARLRFAQQFTLTLTRRARCDAGTVTEHTQQEMSLTTLADQF